MPDPVRATRMLRAMLSVAGVNRRVFELGQTTRDEIITTSRFILILHGRLRYTVEGRARTLSAGTQFFVPAWVRRVWTVPSGGPCEIAWCEVDDPAQEGAGLLRRVLAPAVLRRETAAYRDLLRLFQSGPSPWRDLALEAAVKVMLVRFLEEARGDEEPSAMVVHPRIKERLRWLEHHFARPDVLAEMYRGCGLTRNYFCALFSEATRLTPHEYIERLRLRRARILLLETNWQLKRIAAEVGYDDPLYFSRLYRRFWRRSPSAEREGVIVSRSRRPKQTPPSGR
jgi:AraC-like DNA-binding protein